MKLDIEKEVAALQKMTTGQLCECYAELFGETTRTRHRTNLVRKIAWKLQALADGDLSERARRRAEHRIVSRGVIRYFEYRSARCSCNNLAAICLTEPQARDGTDVVPARVVQVVKAPAAPGVWYELPSILKRNRTRPGENFLKGSITEPLTCSVIE